MKKLIPILLVLVLIGCVGFAWVTSILIERKTPTKERMDKDLYYNITESDQVPLIVNGQVLETYGKIIDDKVFIDYETVHTMINKRFYWDRNESVLIYTLPTEIKEYRLTEKHEDYRIVDYVLYISMDEIIAYSDIEYEILNDPNRIVIRNEWDNLHVTYASKDTHVRYRGGIKSEILTDVPEGTEVQVLDGDTFENWAHVATSDGYVGYIDKDHITETQKKENTHVYNGPEYTSISRDYKINMTWHQVTNAVANDTLEDLLANTSGVNVVAPTWFFINDINGNMVNLSSSDYVQKAHAHGMEVWAVLNDFDGDMGSKESTYTVLSKTSARRKIINEVVSSVLECGADGINVDIEKVSEKGAEHYLQFIRELSVQCRLNNLVLSIDNYVPTYSGYFDRKEQGIVADYVVIMGYDEHFSGSEVAGSVASLPFVEDGIIRTLEEVPAEKVINGVPFYTRIWKTDNYGVVTSEACTMSAAEEFLVTNGLEKYWDEDVSQHYSEVQLEDGLYQIWMEDAKSIEAKMKVIQEKNLAGVASWKLGFETPDIWGVIGKYLQ